MMTPLLNQGETMRIGLTLPARLLAVALAATLCTAVFAADPKLKADYENRLESVKALSQALQRDAASSSAESKAALAKVQARQKEAAELAAVGEYGLAKSILDEGYQALSVTLAKTKAVPGVGVPAAADSGKLKQDIEKAAFERELASAQALLEAAKRSDAEKGNQQRGEIGQIEKLIDSAKSAAGKNDFGAADKLLVEALDKEKRLIARLKAGESAGAPAAVTGNDAQERDRKAQAVGHQLASSRALLVALKRQNAERQAGKESLIKDAEQNLGRAEALVNSDPAQAQQLTSEVDGKVRTALQSLQEPSGLKSGSAALDAAPKTGPSASDTKKSEIARMLRSAVALRDSLARQSSERGVDSSATLKQIDQLTTEAKQHEKADLDRALKSAEDAYESAKLAIEKLRKGG
jgi:hypothetical protein